MVVHRGAPYVFPTTCICPLKTPVVQETTAGGAITVARRCTGEFACPFQKIRHLMHFVSRRAFDIEGMGEKQLQAFLDEGWITEPADIFRLARDEERLAVLGRIVEEYKKRFKWVRPGLFKTQLAEDLAQDTQTLTELLHSQGAWAAENDHKALSNSRSTDCGPQTATRAPCPVALRNKRQTCWVLSGMLK